MRPGFHPVVLRGGSPSRACGFALFFRKMSGITMLHGPDATVDSVGIKSFEERPVAVEAARELGHKIAEALGAK